MSTLWGAFHIIGLFYFYIFNIRIKKIINYLALSKYYKVTHLKETQYLEYKYRKQKYLLELDYENIKQAKKEKNIKRYDKFYIEKMDGLYKGILKNYSVQLADNLKVSANDKNEIYDKVFDTVEEYILNILYMKINTEEYSVEKDTLEQYDKYSKFLAGKPDSIDLLEKKMIILAISRKLFTHSLPLIIAEQCYEQLLNEVRSELVHSKNDRKFKKAYKMLLNIIEEYKVNLLSTKIYWERPKDREEYKKFWEEFKKINLSEKNNKELRKEILFIKNDLKKISNEPKRYKLVIDVYKKKLVELGAMKQLKDKCITPKGKFVKIKNIKEETKNKAETKANTKTSLKKETAPKKRGRPKKVETKADKEVKKKTTRVRSTTKK